MTRARAVGNYAVQAQRRGGSVPPNGALDFFPTPPWATRALMKYVLPPLGIGNFAPLVVWEPFAGALHMAEPLGEFFRDVHCSDVFDYGYDYRLGSFVGMDGLPPPKGGVDLIISNPPFAIATEAVERALDVARIGVAFLLRTQWVETEERYDLFSRRPPAAMAVFMGRCAMVENRWDPQASTATSYAWFVWITGQTRSRLLFIPPKTKYELTKPTDVAKFGERGWFDHDEHVQSWKRYMKRGARSVDRDRRG